MSTPPRLRCVPGFRLDFKGRGARSRNARAREAVEDLPPYIASRSDNIDLLAANLRELRPYILFTAAAKRFAEVDAEIDAEIRAMFKPDGAA